MIEISELTENDIGRAVVYCREGPREDGTITSYNSYWVFVRYKPGQYPRPFEGVGAGVATYPRDLEWVS